MCSVPVEEVDTVWSLDFAHAVCIVDRPMNHCYCLNALSVAYGQYLHMMYYWKSVKPDSEVEILCVISFDTCCLEFVAHA